MRGGSGRCCRSSRPCSKDAARERAAAAGKREIDPADYIPACVEACPTGAIQFGDLNDPSSVPAQDAGKSGSFRLLEKLGTETKIYYRSQREWVRQIAGAPRPPALRNIATKENPHG